MTPNEAAELMRRSQVGGVATSEFNAGGGYDAVKKLAESNTIGFQQGVRTAADMAKYAPKDVAVRFDPAGQGGLGETFYASGNSATGKPLTEIKTETPKTTTTTTTSENDYATYLKTLAAVLAQTGQKLGPNGTVVSFTSEDAYDVFQKARAAANKEASAALDFSGSRGAATDQSVALSQAIVNKAGADALAKIGFMVDANGAMVKIGSASTTNTGTGTSGTTTSAGSSPVTGGAVTGASTVTPGSTISAGSNPITGGAVTGTSTVAPGSTTSAGSSPITGGAVTGTSTVTPGSTGGTGLIAGATTANSTAASTAGSVPTASGLAAKANTQTLPIQLNAPTATGGGGLLTGANTLAYTPGTFNIPNTATGNVNDGGLISGVMQQMYTQNAQVGLPTGVMPKVGMMGNNTGAQSITAYNPYGFTGANTATGNSQNWYNAKTGQRYTAPAGTWTPPSADWAMV
tara:strand:- start:954 stop:2336 length:1383 start_codon:yes stop_codon:yes gene_type:complete